MALDVRQRKVLRQDESPRSDQGDAAGNGEVREVRLNKSGESI